jgi:hypothetical protein
MIATSSLSTSAIRKALFGAMAAAGVLVAGSATANAANYQNGALKNCPGANSCTLNFPAPGGSLRVDYVSCRLLTNPASNAWVISVFNGTHAIFLDTQQQDAAGIRRSFTTSNQMKYFVGSGAYTINVLTGAFVDIQLACTVVGVVT